MRKIQKSPFIPNTLSHAPVPTQPQDVDPLIYKADDVREQLLQDQGYKCAYCESKVTKQYNDVEHYRPKTHYYWLGHTWSNLLYACPICNRSLKNASFPLKAGSTRANTPDDDLTLEQPLLINPAEVDPTFHIKFRRHVAVALTNEGKTTIKTFKLNTRKELKNNREKIYEDYENEEKKCKVAQIILNQTNLPQKTIDLANEILLLSRDTLDKMTTPSSPYSGMLIAQMP